MTEEWTHEPVEIEDMPTTVASRYTLPKAFLDARKQLNPNQRAVIEELAERYRRAASEKPVAATIRQIMAARNMTRMSVARAILALIEKGFIVVVDKGDIYKAKRKPSRYRLTFYPCDGEDATNDYIEDPKAWRRAGKRRAPTTLPPTVRLQVIVPPSHLMDVAEALQNALPRVGA
jgi:hypothetical protein